MLRLARAVSVSSGACFFMAGAVRSLWTLLLGFFALRLFGQGATTRLARAPDPTLIRAVTLPPVMWFRPRRSDAPPAVVVFGRAVTLPVV